ncbi:MAG: heavy metal translocating P-type ATPase, partial [Polaromonas sp.]|nr:heavy metal translocating P-type ATPase [Polaromonas sp.]
MNTKTPLARQAYTHDCCSPDSKHPHAVIASDLQPLPGSGRLFRIATMDCAVEESEIRQALEPVPGIRSLGFQLGARTLKIDAAPDAFPLALEAIRKAGFDPRPLAVNGADRAGQAGENDEFADGHGRNLGTGLWRLAAALAMAIGAETISFVAPDTTPWKGAGMAFAAVAIWLAGIDTYKKGMGALLRGKLNINALMAVAVTGAFLIGQWPEAAMVMALYAIAELIEARAVDRARNAIKGLLDMTPPEALVLGAEAAAALTPVAAVPLGAVVRIKPGERVPLDGVVTQGISAVNQAPITGESIPVDKAVGDPVFAGSINETGELEFRVTALSTNTTLARIIEAVEQAQGNRAPTQRFVDRFAAIYTPAVFVVAVAVAVLTPFLLDLTWLEAIYKALVLLVIACPCAFVISTPVTVVSGLTAAARRGILVKGGSFLETARGLKVVALDKTGTLTAGRPALVAWQAWNGTAEAEVRRAAAALAERSDHPVSLAIATGLAAGVTPAAAASEPAVA